MDESLALPKRRVRAAASVYSRRASRKHAYAVSENNMDSYIEQLDDLPRHHYSSQTPTSYETKRKKSKYSMKSKSNKKKNNGSYNSSPYNKWFNRVEFNYTYTYYYIFYIFYIFYIYNMF